MKIDIDDCTYYQAADTKMADTKRTENRLTEISELGMEVVGTAEFGYPGVMSGLYIEKVWNATQDEWDSYIKWASYLIIKELRGKADRLADSIVISTLVRQHTLTEYGIGADVRVIEGHIAVKV